MGCKNMNINFTFCSLVFEPVSHHPSPVTRHYLLFTIDLSPITLITVISGRLKKRIGTCVVAIPRFTYIFVLPRTKSPLIKGDLLAFLDFSTRKGMPI